jgi:hypothetical protein
VTPPHVFANLITGDVSIEFTRPSHALVNQASQSAANPVMRTSHALVRLIKKIALAPVKKLSQAFNGSIGVAPVSKRCLMEDVGRMDTSSSYSVSAKRQRVDQKPVLMPNKRRRVDRDPTPASRDLRIRATASGYSGVSSLAAASARSVVRQKQPRQQEPSATQAETDDESVSIPRQAEILALFDEHLVASPMRDVRTSGMQKVPAYLPHDDRSSSVNSNDDESDSAAQPAYATRPATLRTHVRPRALASAPAPAPATDLRAANRNNIHGREQYGFRDGRGWRNEDTPLQDHDWVEDTMGGGNKDTLDDASETSEPDVESFQYGPPYETISHESEAPQTSFIN